jgi:hypothetical protein
MVLCGPIQLLSPLDEGTHTHLHDRDEFMDQFHEMIDVVARLLQTTKEIARFA